MAKLIGFKEIELCSFILLYIRVKMTSYETKISIKNPYNK